MNKKISLVSVVLGVMFFAMFGWTGMASCAELPVLNPSCEILNEKGDYPLHWGRYLGSGGAKFGVSEEAHTGKRSVYLKATSYQKYRERDYLGSAILVGSSNGSTGKNAYRCKPDTEYQFSFWLKSDFTRMSIQALTWKTESALDRDREWLKTSLGFITPTSDWKKYEGTFTTKPDSKKFVLMMYPYGFKDEGMNLGTMWVDDVSITEVMSVGVYRSDGAAGYRGVFTTLQDTPGIKVEFTKNFSLKNLSRYDALVIPDIKQLGLNEPAWWMDSLRSYVADCGGSILFYHDSVGFMRSPLSRRNLFPEVALGGGKADKESNWPTPYRIVLADNDHFITKKYKKTGEIFPLMYCDVITVKPGPEGKVLFASPKGLPVVVAGEVGKGRVVFNGTIIYGPPSVLKVASADTSEGEAAKVTGIDRELLLNTINWFAQKPSWIDVKATKLALAKFQERKKESKKGKAEICIIPTPQKMEVGKGEILLSKDDSSQAIIVIGEKADSRVLSGAEAIKEKVKKLGGKIEIRKPSELSNKELSQYNLILLGGEENSLARRYIRKNRKLFSGEYSLSKTNPGKEGYIIKSFKNEYNKDCILAGGSDLQGTMYAGYSLYYTIFKKNNRIFSKEVSIWDKPDFEYRSIEQFSNFDKGKLSSKRMIDWYSRHKVNMVEILSFYDRVPSVVSEEKLAMWREIGEYARSKGVKLILAGYWDLVAKVPPGYSCVSVHGRPYCWSDPKLWEIRRKELRLMIEKVKPDSLFFHPFDAQLKHVKTMFSHGSRHGKACKRCREMFKTVAQADAYYINQLYKTIREVDKNLMIKVVLYSYINNLSAPYMKKEKEYYQEVASLIPDDVVILIREVSRDAVKAYKDAIGKNDLEMAQYVYTHYDSRDYKGPVKIFHHCVWPVYTELTRTARASVTGWKAGRSDEVSDEILETICRELYGEEAGPYMAAVLIPDYRTCNKTFNMITSYYIFAPRTNFDLDYLKEKVAEFDKALKNLKEAEKRAGGFYPKLTLKTIHSFRRSVETMKKWCLVHELKCKKDPAFKKSLDEFADYLNKEKPAYWQTYMKTIGKMRKK